MTQLHETIPNSDIWLAAESTVLTHGLEARDIVARTIAEYEQKGDECQVRAWQTVAHAVRELMDAALYNTSHAIH